MLHSCTAMLQAPRALCVQEGFLFTLEKSVSSEAGLDLS